MQPKLILLLLGKSYINLCGRSVTVLKIKALQAVVSHQFNWVLCKGFKQDADYNSRQHWLPVSFVSIGCLLIKFNNLSNGVHVILYSFWEMQDFFFRIQFSYETRFCQKLVKLTIISTFILWKARENKWRISLCRVHVNSS